MTVLALAVTGRGLVDPTEPVIRADDDGLLRGRAAFETLRVYAGRPFRPGGASRSPDGLGREHRAPLGRAPPSPGARRSRAPEGIRRRRVAPPRLDGGPVGRGSVGVRAPQQRARLDRCRTGAGRDGSVAPRRPRVCAVAPPRREVDELRREHGRRGGGAQARSRGGVLRRRGRDRPRGNRDERLVARRRDAVHAVARPRHPRRRDARDADGARTGVRLPDRGGRVPARASCSPPRRRSRRRPCARSCRSSRSTGSRSGEGPAADTLQAALRELAAKV